MQFRSTSHRPAFEIGNDDSAVACTFCGIAFDEAIVHEAVEAVMATFPIKPQKMIAQQRQFFLLTQRSNGALGSRRTDDVLVAHIKSPLGWPSRRRRIPRSPILCIATWNSSR